VTSRTRAIALTICMLIAPTTVIAAQRTFVASYGNDASPCTVASPCRGFQAALAQTNTKGEVVVLHSAGYGPVAISQSVTITAPAGIYAGISVFSGDGVSINSPVNPIFVRLVGLTIVGQNPAAAKGISISGDSSVVVQRCSATAMQIGVFIDSLSFQAKTIEASEFSANQVGMDLAGVVNVVNTVANRNLNQGMIHRSGYIFIRGSTFDYNLAGATLEDLVVGADSTAIVENSEFQNNSFAGLSAVGYTITVRGSTIAANGGVGTAIGPRASLIGSLIVRNMAGGFASGVDGVATLDGATITNNNAYGVNIGAGSVVQTLQNNTIMNNMPSDIVGGALTVIGHQ
jgi:hypothetical protein